MRGALLAAGASEVAEAAAEIVRVEPGRPRYGVDLDETVIPQEAGLNERAVSFDEGLLRRPGDGRAAPLPRQAEPPPARAAALARRSRPAPPLRLGEKEVGRVTSPVVSPAHGPIALALVRREAAPGDTLAAGDDGVTAVVVELPF